MNNLANDISNFSMEEIKAYMDHMIHKGKLADINQNVATVEDYPTLNQKKTDKFNRAIYDMVPFITIRAPFQRKSTVVRPWKDTDMREYSIPWNNYINTKPNEDATPLNVWPYASKGFILEMKEVNINSMEQLISLNEDEIKYMGNGIEDMIAKAKQFMSGVTDLELELATANNVISKMEDEIANLKLKINMVKHSKPKPKKKSTKKASK